MTVLDNRNRTQTGMCSTSSSYQSASDPRVHFGLADASTVRRAEVRWPSGITQVLTDVTSNQVLEIIERASNSQ